MSPSLEQLKTTLSGLPAVERAELAQYLLRSLDPEEEGAETEWLALAEQRMAEVRAGRVVGIPADEITRAGGTAMPVSIEALGIHQLSVGERLELIEQIWNSLPEQVAPQEVPQWHLAELAKRRAQAESQQSHREELDRRLAAADADPSAGSPWEEVRARLRGGQ